MLGPVAKPVQATTAVSAAVPPFPRSPIAAAYPPEDLVIMSPFGVNGVPSPTASAPPAPVQVLEETQQTMSTIQKIALGALGGLALFGAMGLGGCSSPPKAQAADSASHSQNIDLGPAANDNRQSANDNRQTAPQQRVAADTGRTQAQPPRRMRVLGQDVGDDSAAQGIEWKTYAGTYKGQSYEIEYPKGWKVAKTFYGIAIVNQQKPDEFVTFQWRQDAGQMSPQNLLQNVLQEAQAGNMRVNSQRMEPTRQTPNGPLYVMMSDLSYTVDGAPVRGAFMTAVTSNNGYVPYWVGSVVATQSTEADFQQDTPVLQHIANSMTQK